MALHQFTYYVHDSYESYERADYILGQLTDLDMDVESFVKLTGEPFYELKLTCTLDDSTGAVTIVTAAPS